MAEKFIELSSGELVENEALQSSAGVADAGKIPALDSAGVLDISLMPAGIGADVQTMPAFEGLSAGDIVNTFSDGGVLSARKADASNSYKANGFVKEAVTSGQTATVYFEGKNTALTGLTVGADLYLSATAGEVTETAVTTSGYISQRVGTALLSTSMTFEPAQAVTLA